MKKFWLIVATILLALFVAGSALANEGEAIDVIMLLDCSGSMRTNDRHLLMIKSAMNFIDMCDVSGSRVALIPFNSESILTAPYWSGCARFRSLDNVTERELLRHDLLANGLHYGNDTDAGLGYELAWNLYTSLAQDPNANPNTIVVFFSDGKVDVSQGPAKTAESMEKAEQAINNFAAAGVPIYCIGLNSRNGDFDKVWLDSIAERTGTGEAEVVVEGDSAVLHRLFSDIFAEYLGTEPLEIDNRDIVVEDGEAVIAINIPNNSIIEANIRLSLQNPTATSSFGEVGTLTRPDGSVVEPLTSGTPGPGDVVVGNSGAYYNLKLIRPVQGEWKLVIKVSDAELVNAEMISNYDIGIRFREVDIDALEKGDELVLEAEYYSTRTGEVYSDEFLSRLDLITESVATHNGEPIADNFYQVDPETLRFVGKVDRLDSGEYRFKVKVNGDGIHIETATIAFNLDNRPPVRIGEDPQPLELSVDSMLWRTANDTYEINLHEYFRDPDGDTLNFTRVGGNPDAMQTRITSSGILTISCTGVAEGTLTIKCDDGLEEASRSLPIVFEITSCKAQATKELIAGIVALIALIVLLLIIKHKMRGRFLKTAVFEASYSGLSINPLPNSMIWLSRYDDKKVSLYRVLDHAGVGVGPCTEMTDTEKSILSGFTLEPKRKGIIKLINQSSGGMRVAVNGQQLNRRQSVELNNSHSIQIDFMEPGRSITLLYHF